MPRLPHQGNPSRSPFSASSPPSSRGKGRGAHPDCGPGPSCGGRFQWPDHWEANANQAAEGPGLGKGVSSGEQGPTSFPRSRLGNPRGDGGHGKFIPGGKRAVRTGLWPGFPGAWPWGGHTLRKPSLPAVRWLLWPQAGRRAWLLSRDMQTFQNLLHSTSVRAAPSRPTSRTLGPGSRASTGCHLEFGLRPLDRDLWK